MRRESCVKRKTQYAIRNTESGFTLIEVLVAVAIIATIVSMVYGSYLAASRSAGLCKAKMALSKDTQKALQQMAGQIRCTYAGHVPRPSCLVPHHPKDDGRWTMDDGQDYFSGNYDDFRGQILHLVTTNAIFEDRNFADGLFEVAYQFDKSRGVLSVSQERFTGPSESISAERAWQPLPGNVKSVQLQFFDGKRWLNKWDFKDQMELPRAVKIDLIFQDENYRQCHYNTIVYVCCQKNIKN